MTAARAEEQVARLQHSLQQAAYESAVVAPHKAHSAGMPVKVVLKPGEIPKTQSQLARQYRSLVTPAWCERPPFRP